jgi:hypothetical protein
VSEGWWGLGMEDAFLVLHIFNFIQVVVCWDGSELKLSLPFVLYYIAPAKLFEP